MASTAKPLPTTPSDDGVAFSRAAYALLASGYSNTDLIILIREQSKLLRASKVEASAEKKAASKAPASAITGNATQAPKAN